MVPPTVLVISPLYLPQEEGLAHYTTEFCRHLAKIGRVVVLTSVESAGLSHGPGSVVVLGAVKRWTFLGPFRALMQALQVEPDRVLVQFVPFMYARRGGINLTIVLLAAALSLRAGLRGRGQLQVMYHELWYPFSWQPKAAFMHLVHRCMVFGTSLVARDVFCATSRFADQVRRNLGPLRKRVHVLPVGSNLERDEGAASSAASGPSDVTKIALFGSLHPSKNVPLVLRTLHEASRTAANPFELTVIGLTHEQIEAAVPDLADWIASDVETTGPLDAAEVARRLREQDFLVAYFQDGVSGRRGSLLAALCEGLPVVTTWRDFSDEAFAGRPFVKLLSCEEPAFREELLALLRAPQRPFADVDRSDVRRFYDEHFSWSAVVTRYARLSRLDGHAHELPVG